MHIGGGLKGIACPTPSVVQLLKERSEEQLAQEIGLTRAQTLLKDADGDVIARDIPIFANYPIVGHRAHKLRWEHPS
jgi:hypothetical protein